MQFSSSSARLQPKNKNVNPFLSGNNSGNNSNNAFMNKEQLQRENQEKKEETVNEPKVKEPKVKEPKDLAEEFPALTTKATTATATKPNSQSKSSYKNLLVSTIDREMAEEQLKMRSAQAAEVERGKEYYSKVLNSDVRAARAASASASANAAATDLELLYDEDGDEYCGR